ncbi:MAG: aminotransferase class I/II-fold pyridoxal phosphate-dependent enzyme, partial [Candidatus Omnitrophota bacterium]|nr:aminotransferase class I/II-fold pyridoxal phosphate-dependent enzyme [Candidatus Omnitrophota bacterium]
MAGLNFLHGGNIYNFKKEVIDFSANINPLGLPLGIKESIYKNLESILHYPDPQARGLTAGISRYWGIGRENILAGNGSIELIYLILHALKPKTAIIPVPSFSEYERAAGIANCKIRFLKLKEKEGFKLNLASLGNADILFVPNPNNPTGNLLLQEPAAIKKFPGSLIVADEAFMDFLPDEKKHTLIWRAVKHKNLIVLRTFTKFFALPGLRAGYLVAHRDIVRSLSRYQPPWSVNTLAQIAAGTLLCDKTYIEKTRFFVEKERAFLFNALARIEGLKPFQS